MVFTTVKFFLIPKIQSAPQYWLIPLLLFFTVGTSGCFAQAKFKVQGKIKGIESGTAFLTCYDLITDKNAVIDSAKITNGVFQFAGHVDVPKIMLVTLEPGTWTFQVFIENTAIGLSIDTTEAEHLDFTKYGYGKRSTITRYKEYGSKNDSLYQQFQNTQPYRNYLTEFVDLRNRLNNKTINPNDEKLIRQQLDSLNDKFTELKNNRFLNL